MAFPKWLFRFAGIYGLIALAPLYFLETRIGQDDPPAITHPEFFYGSIGVGLAWQVAFLVIARDPMRFRLMMIPAVLEKASFGIATIVLYSQHRLAATALGFGLFDLLLGVLFAVAFWRTAIRRI